jgi:hypothetical protein
MFHKRSVSLVALFVFIFLTFSCAPKPVQVAATADSYSYTAPTGDNYAFSILPKEPNEFADKYAPRSSARLYALAAEPAPTKPVSYTEDDFYCGVDRASCKTSLNASEYESFSDLKSFLNSLPSDDHMTSLKISRESGSPRVTEELRNISIKKTYIYAIKHEPDKDYHIIIGDSAGANFFNVEITGLPDEGQQDFNALLNVRLAVKTFFDHRVRISEKYNKPDPPIPVSISGSLFYDVDHAPGIVGPAGLRPKTSWEIHPVSKIEFLKR